jgi:hypothetical protein
MRIVNLTGHELVLGTEDGQVRYISRGKVRLDTRYKTVDQIRLQDENGKRSDVELPLLELANGETTTLPTQINNVLYVVSGIVAGRVRRPDIVAPARLHRGQSGKVEYARALLRYGERL